MKASAKTSASFSLPANKSRLRRMLKEMLAGKKPTPVFPLINPDFQPYRRIIE